MYEISPRRVWVNLVGLRGKEVGAKAAEEDHIRIQFTVSTVTSEKGRELKA